MILRVLAQRGIATTPQQRQWIEQCAEEATLIEWFDRAITAETADEIFG